MSLMPSLVRQSPRLPFYLPALFPRFARAQGACLSNTTDITARAAMMRGEPAPRASMSPTPTGKATIPITGTHLLQDATAMPRASAGSISCQAKQSNAPAADESPLPPLNLRNAGQLWPATGAQATAASNSPRSQVELTPAGPTGTGDGPSPRTSPKPAARATASGNAPLARSNSVVRMAAPGPASLHAPAPPGLSPISSGDLPVRRLTNQSAGNKEPTR